MSTRLLSVCTSFRRPHQLPDMLKTFFETRSEGTEILVRLHDDDPKLMDYEKVKEAFPLVIWETGPHMCMRETLNFYTALYPEIPYRQIITDDALYLTQNWDEKLLTEFKKRSNGWGFICGDDQSNNTWFNWEHPSMEIWSYKQAALIGYAYPVQLRHHGQDTWTKEMCKELGFCPLVPDVFIRHLQGAGATNPDENLAAVNSPEAYHEAMAGLDVWRAVEKERTLRLIREARERGE